MRYLKPLILSGLLLASACSTRPFTPCGQEQVPGGPSGLFESRTSIAAGRYRLSFQATAGSAAGKTVAGTLVLISPPLDAVAEGRLLYGTFDGDLNAVGAPLCPEDNPAATSPDPDYPGVLLEQLRGNTQSFTIASAGHQRGVLVADGCGIFLRVDTVTSAGFSGSWGPEGIVVDGCGTFEATVLREP